MGPRGILAKDAAPTAIDKTPGPSAPGRASADIPATRADQVAAIAYFGPDLDDPVVRRRVAQWRYAGFRVLPFAFSRTSNSRLELERGEFVDLGHVMPLTRARRAIPLMLAAMRLVAARRILSGIDVFVARNLDIVLLALFARWAVGSSAPVVYEVLDINSSCTDAGWRSAMLRRLETWVLRHTNLLVLSSPYFGTDYYQKALHYDRPWFLLENKIPKWVRFEGLERSAGKKPATAKPSAAGRPWRIGWFGYLDDQKSWDILRLLAQQLPEDVYVHVRGRPYTNFNMAGFLADVEQLDNVTYGGPFRNPEDLAEVYGAVDIVWSIDCNFPTGNSKWLLTNGLYEAGYFAKPALGLGGTAVGEFLATYGSGWCLGEPLAENLLRFVTKLTREEYEAKRQAIAGLSPDIFVETDEIERLWRALQREARHAVPAQ